MAQVEYQHLSAPEIEFLDHSMRSGLITSSDLPRGISIGLDSMGPVRDSKTDALFPGMRETLYRFRDTIERYDLTLVVATNGPDIEGVDILEAVNPNHSIRAYAVTEGGGRLITPSIQDSGWNFRTLAHPEEVRHLNDIAQGASRKSRLIEALLADTEPNGEDAPIRTPYKTNIVLTFPNSLDTLKARLIEGGVDLEAAMPDISPQNYLDRMLSFTHDKLHDSISGLGLENDFSQLTKKQNRRHYVTPRHLAEELKQVELSKIGGVWFASAILSRDFPGIYKHYSIPDSVYIADKAVDTTGEGQIVIGASERSMIVGLTYFVGKPMPGMKVVRTHSVIPQPEGGNLHFADVGTRLAFNITMDDADPSITDVEGVRVLHIGSGGKALEALEHLYGKLYP